MRTTRGQLDGGAVPGAVPGAVWAGGRAWCAAAVLLMAAAGCRRAPPEMPESPPDAATTVLQGLTENQPRVLWDALPASYQADVRGLIGEFCRRMDAGIYDRTFRILQKGVQVLQRKKEYIFNSPLTLDNPIIETSLGLHWGEMVAVLETLVESDVASLERLRGLDPGAFLAGTGSRLMGQLERLTELTQTPPERNPWAQARRALEQAQIRFVPGTNQQGFLSFGPAGQAPEREVEMVRVENRWVPDGVARLRAGLARLEGPEFQRAKPVIVMVQDALERAMDSLLKAGSQQEFDATLKSLAAIREMARAWSDNSPPSQPSSGSDSSP